MYSNNIVSLYYYQNQFDDVERKEDPTLRPFLPSKRVDISDERSKRSLAELYEDDYVKQKSGDKTNAKDEALKQEHEDITTMFESLCHKLDSLSNFHFTPKAVSSIYIYILFIIMHFDMYMDYPYMYERYNFF